MKLAKAQIDFGLCTNNIDALLSFWQTDVGLQLDHVLPVRRGQTQHRHDALGSFIKINRIVKGLPQTTPSGYRELLIARPNLAHPQRLTDPDGNRVTLLPRGNEGVNQIGIRLTVRNLDAHRAFYTNVLELEEQPTFDGAAIRAGETRLILEEQPDAPVESPMQGHGWRYITFQVFNVDEAHAKVLAAGGREGLAPVTLGKTARISMILDPDGNWIELSQRASIVGSL